MYAGGCHVLLTRPEADSRRLVPEMTARGCRATLAPLIEILPVDGPPLALDGVQALLFTSSNGVRAFAARCPRRDLPVYAVGDGTRAAADEAGFVRTLSAGGDVDDLASLVGRHCNPEAGALLHPAGSAVAGDLSGRLGAAGYDVRRVVVYRAEPARTLPPVATRALAGGTITHVLLFSPRTGRTFASLVQASPVPLPCTAVEAICLSPAVARAIRPVAWQRVSIADEPTLAAFLACLDERLQNR